ncbi:carbohydrate ABC transporter permease [Patescibacteria group bacterium]|nr:carbohydrate ABC transporter permease [Patescibacteria group bacterium]
MPPSFLFRPDFSHILLIVKERGFLKYLSNSLVVSFGSTCISLFLGSFAAYALTRYPIKGGKQIAFWMISLRMMPPIVIVLPLYIFFTRIRLIDTYIGLILAHITLSLPFAVWMLMGFFKEIPRELDESAVIDGCTTMGVLFRILFPLVRGGLAATGVFCILWSWNDFIFAFSLTSSEVATLPVPISGFLGDYIWEWSAFYAGGSIAAVPIMLLALFAQKYLVRGMTFGAVKK